MILTNKLSLRCLDDQRSFELHNITALTATDATGQFGVLPGHAPLLTLLIPGLVLVHRADETIYMATAGGMLSLRKNQITLVSSRFVQADALQALMPALESLKRQEVDNRRSRTHQDVDLMYNLTRRLQELQTLK